MVGTLSGDALQSPYAVAFQESLEGWVDERHLSRSQVWSLWVFTAYMENCAEADGWRYDGHSWKNSPGMGVLVVKATVDDRPVVCFTSARTSLNAISIFVRKLSEDGVVWVKDKYRA